MIKLLSRKEVESTSQQDQHKWWICDSLLTNAKNNHANAFFSIDISSFEAKAEYSDTDVLRKSQIVEAVQKCLYRKLGQRLSINEIERRKNHV